MSHQLAKAVHGAEWILERLEDVSDHRAARADLPEAFHDVAKAVPMAREALKHILLYLESETTFLAFQERDENQNMYAERLQAKASRLYDIFDAVIPPNDIPITTLYRSAAGKGGGVEVLMRELLEAIVIIAKPPVLTKTQVNDLEQASQRLSQIRASLPSDRELLLSSHYLAEPRAFHFNSVSPRQRAVDLDTRYTGDVVSPRDLGKDCHPVSAQLAASQTSEHNLPPAHKDDDLDKFSDGSYATDCGPDNENSSSRLPEYWTGLISCQWEVPLVYRKSLCRSSQITSSSIRDFLSRFVALTGDSDAYECATCADFLIKEWSLVAADVLEVMSKALEMVLLSECTQANIQEQETGPNETSMGELDITETTEEQISVRSHGIRSNYVKEDFADAIKWVCTAIRAVPEEQPSGRRRLFKSQSFQIGGNNPFIGSMFLRKHKLDPMHEWFPAGGSDSGCWTKLFREGVIAWRPLRRDWGKGLELSFPLMTRLATVENYHTVDGGIILLGFRTALVPTGQNTQSNSFQWHFEAIEDSFNGFILPDRIRSIQTGWVKCQYPSDFTGSSCFVGWCQEAHVLLGTSELLEGPRHMSMRWSGMKEQTKTLHSTGYEASGQTTFTGGPISFAAQGVKVWEYISNVPEYEAIRQYQGALLSLLKSVAIIIDSDTKQAWLVPTISVVLHLCHVYFQGINQEHTEPNPLPFAQPAYDGFQATYDALKDNGNITVIGNLQKDGGMSLKQLFLRIYTGLAATAGKREEPSGGYIYATELMSILHPPMTGIPLKKIDVSGPESLSSSWDSIVRHVDVVGVCKHLGQVIRPLSSDICAYCSALPKDRFYLAAHMRCVEALAQRAGNSTEDCRFGGGHYALGESDTLWYRSTELWASCPPQQHESIWSETPMRSVLQRISLKGNERRRWSSMNSIPQDGVVVFGYRRPSGLNGLWVW